MVKDECDVLAAAAMSSACEPSIDLSYREDPMGCFVVRLSSHLVGRIFIG
jgi:hypothetical protein